MAGTEEAILAIALMAGTNKEAEAGNWEEIHHASALSEPVKVPSEIVDDPSLLRELLTPEVWRDVLTVQEKEQLKALLPSGMGREDGEDLREVLGQGNLHFGTPLRRVEQSVERGESDPTVAEYKEAVKLLERKAHQCKVRDHHAIMCRSLEAMAEEQARPKKQRKR